MTDLISLLSAIAASFVIAVIGTYMLSRLLIQKGIIDEPNQRSSHVQAKPRGGGIAILAAIAGGTAVLGLAGPAPLPDGSALIGTAVLALALISWTDDVRGLSPLARFLPQVICVGVVLYVTPVTNMPLIDGLPLWLQNGILALAWLWFINLYNFMDGIDGITGIETLVITLGIAALAFVAPDLAELQGPALVIAAASVGFLVWNWAPARIFMGDVGSVPLGFILGWALLRMAGGEYLLAALILPGYYLLDATVTLLSRLMRGEKIWQAHRQHAYQVAVQNGMTHDGVSVRIGFAGLVLICLAVASPSYPWAAGFFAGIVVITLWFYLRRYRA